MEARSCLWRKLNRIFKKKLKKINILILKIKMESTTTLEIPSHMVQEVQDLINNMSIQNRPAEISINKDSVERIKSHKVDRFGNFMFLVRWTDGVEEWVKDEDCFCECLINNYLLTKTQPIHTAYLICRVSTKTQDNPTSISLDAQEDAIRSKVPTFYQRKKVIRVKKSAYTTMPSEIVDICEAATNNNGIFFWRIDRFSRNIEKSIEILKILENKNVYVYSVEEDLEFSNNKHEFYQHILNGQKESIDISKRIRLTLEKKRNRGDEKIGSLPYGKMYDRIIDEFGNTVRMVVKNNTSETYIIKRIKTSKLSCKDMALKLNNQGIRKKGKKWTTNMISYIRKN
jgi:DNA invertase Pin-like site-specific DNA recombinase